jgi:YHS domain-containing protein
LPLYPLEKKETPMPANSISRRNMLKLSLAGAAIGMTATSVFAAKPEIYTGLVSGTGAGGYDVVAYFTQGKPVEGSTDFTADYKGASWRFASAANRDAFAADPAKYAPQYGGHCAYAAARGYIAKGVPEAWTVHDDKLYLNFSLSVRELWLKDVPGHISAGDANWPSLIA